MRFGWVAAAAAMVAAVPAGAAVIEKRISFVASNFAGYSSQPYLSAVSGEFEFDIQTGVSSTNRTLKSAGLSPGFSGTLRFSYDALTDEVKIGTGPDVSSAPLGAGISFNLSSTSLLEHNGANNFSYQLNTGDFVVARNLVIRDMSVPEPATWAMMVLGFGAVGAALRRRPHCRLMRRVQLVA